MVEASGGVRGLDDQAGISCDGTETSERSTGEARGGLERW